MIGGLALPLTGDELMGDGLEMIGGVIGDGPTGDGRPTIGGLTGGGAMDPPG